MIPLIKITVYGYVAGVITVDYSTVTKNYRITNKLADKNIITLWTGTSELLACYIENCIPKSYLIDTELDIQSNCGIHVTKQDLNNVLRKLHVILESLKYIEII
jgi:hypothetical protein